MFSAFLPTSEIEMMLEGLQKHKAFFLKQKIGFEHV